MKITPENTIQLYDHNVTVGTLEVILNTLRKHGSVYVEICLSKMLEDVPTLAQIIFPIK